MQYYEILFLVSSPPSPFASGLLGKLGLFHGLGGVDHPRRHAAVVGLQPGVQLDGASGAAERQLGTQVTGQDAKARGEDHLVVLKNCFLPHQLKNHINPELFFWVCFLINMVFWDDLFLTLPIFGKWSRLMIFDDHSMLLFGNIFLAQKQKKKKNKRNLQRIQMKGQTSLGSRFLGHLVVAVNHPALPVEPHGFRTQRQVGPYRNSGNTWNSDWCAWFVLSVNTPLHAPKNAIYSFELVAKSRKTRAGNLPKKTAQTKSATNIQAPKQKIRQTSSKQTNLTYIKIIQNPEMQQILKTNFPDRSGAHRWCLHNELPARQQHAEALRLRSERANGSVKPCWTKNQKRD